MNEYKETPREIIFDILICFAGSAIYAAGVNIFISPNGFASSGVTGLALIVNYLWKFPTGITMFLMNVPLFIWSYFELGKKFLIKSALTTLSSSLIIDLCARFMPKYTGDTLLAAIFAGGFMGLGLGLIFTRGSTSGGSDIVSRIFNKKYPQMSMGTLMTVLDLTVALISGIVYKNVEDILYAVIVFFVSGRVIDFVVYGSDKGKLLLIVSDNAKAVADEITSKTPRGVSILPATGAYTGKEKNVLMCVVHPNEVTKIRKLVSKFDEHPFIIITDASEILGQGFKRYQE